MALFWAEAERQCPLINDSIFSKGTVLLCQCSRRKAEVWTPALRSTRGWFRSREAIANGQGKAWVILCEQCEGEQRFAAHAAGIWSYYVVDVK